ncbi:5-formyltetrahydrofolate cyclo-ligase [Peribacillus huizhouensis]|uniref:5-formyltetrahydrofolate cyclo-ligase n=1 Tax=Peribacillus huizhouensis TaxID=1501239 RepID=A0ABR6CM31_9BACI|nr:5-formyltetrahydrofolate cyclo-ligase [Peribacillus huizhouensis]MBA9025422.1 5-formyltetrahydrofolate cyclo-ligase [Peribacillus huizhouensis]
MTDIKRKIREEMKRRLSSLSTIEHTQFSRDIAQNVFALKEWKQAETIGITVAVHPEPETKFIIEQAWLEGKRVAVPKCIPSSKQLDFRYITSFSELETVYFGLLEPVLQTEHANKEDLSLLVVPGLAFTRQGYRLGFGGGYYDRFLTDYKGKLLSLAFELQLMEYLPIEGHDIPVAQIITPNHVYSTKH